MSEITLLRPSSRMRFELPYRSQNPFLVPASAIPTLPQSVKRRLAIIGVAVEFAGSRRVRLSRSRLLATITPLDLHVR